MQQTRIADMPCRQSAGDFAGALDLYQLQP